AAVLRAGPPTGELRVGAAAEHTWPRTLDIMGWMIDPVGFRVMLSRSLPRFVEQKLAAPVRRFVKAAQLQAPHLICHPGGGKVLDAIEVALDLQKGTLRDEREVLRNYGNTAAGRSPLGDREPWAPVDHARPRVAGHGAGHARSLSMDQASELSDR